MLPCSGFFGKLSFKPTSPAPLPCRPLYCGITVIEGQRGNLLSFRQLHTIVKWKHICKWRNFGCFVPTRSWVLTKVLSYRERERGDKTHSTVDKLEVSTAPNPYYLFPHFHLPYPHSLQTHCVTRSPDLGWNGKLNIQAAWKCTHGSTWALSINVPNGVV